MSYKKYAASMLACVLLLVSLGAVSLADTIRLKDGTVIRGEVVGFRDQQFTVLIGAGARGGGRRSRITLYMEDVDSIEFDATAAGNSRNAANDNAGVDAGSAGTITQPRQADTSSGGERSSASDSVATNSGADQVSSQPSRTQTSPTFFQINTRVRADNTTNGWTNSGLVVRRGQRIRINASGRVSIGGGRYSTPAGLPSLPDKDKLMRNEPTGGLIAVIGDNNDDFIFIGRSREFRAEREGVLFLGVNEGVLNDNSGTYDTVIEAEATPGN
ncbi:MAG: hypothetical protein ABR577_17895 [Pyrinomonadaceae bacterium]